MKRKKISGFLVILMGVTILWFISKYKNVYEEEVQVEVQWNQIPEDIKIQEDSETIVFNPRLRQRGFKLMANKIFKPTVKLNFEKFTFSRNDSIFFNPFLEKEELSKVDRELSIQDVKNQDIYIPATRFERKKVPISTNFKIKYANNFKAKVPFKLERDSIILFGKNKLLSEVDSLILTSEPILINDTLVERKLKLTLPTDDIKANVDHVQVTFRAMEVTEGSFIVPVEILSKPANSFVKVIPETVTVIYQAAIDNFESITEDDLTVRLDIEKVQESSKVMVPEIIYDSDLIYHARLKEEAVQVLIVK
ncbi:hypothetical protein BST97_07310 [Nonlabens spongiae]|uniref:YbbR-like domain-containing protein n=1 Tax=Nonlabens spongiae TaxID=331648 RepID=A0A1W6MJR7_9FLAO|nr:hypothetical protein [Nonlabens spongiae]ARN77823.1 hypothetical protein BST97_07310 [Nonlabens spongiae]